MPSRLRALVGAAASFLLLAATDPPGTVTVAAQGVRSSKGKVMVELCPRAAFPGPCAWAGEAPARPGTVIVAVRGVPPGSYAVLAFHDANGNRRLDTFLRVPREGFGFSRMTRVPFRMPTFDDVRVEHGAADQRVPVSLHYLW